MGFLDGVAKTLGTAYDYATPGKGSSTLTDWGSYKETGAKAAPKPTTTSAPKTSASTSATDQAIAALRAQIEASSAASARLSAQIAAQPRLPSFDYSANYAKAQSTAASTVNPVYQDKLNRYLEKNAAALGQETTTRTRNKEDIATELSQSLQDTALSRDRTTEDAAIKEGDITANENSWQRQEGRAFDQARTALLGDVASSGLTESGIGQGKVQDATVDRNLQSEDQTREFANQKRDTELFKTRTLADLDTTDTRQTGGAARRTENEDIALRDFIEDQSLDERATRADLEYGRVTDINNATQSAYQSIVAQTIAALAGSGARSQDIALFKQVYG